MTRRLILSLAAILAIGACSDQEDRSTTGPETPSEASSRSPRKYVISFSRQTAIDIEASIKTAGGKVRRASKAAGVATASSSDPAFAPGTGTPEPGGLATVDLLRMVRQLALEHDVVGMDVVEVSPAYDVSDLTVNVAHRMVFECLGGLAERRRQRLADT